jgi:hypothetical protein
LRTDPEPLRAVAGTRNAVLTTPVTWLRYTRNRITYAKLPPALAATFPNFKETFARSAQYHLQGQDLTNELAANIQVVGGHARSSLQKLSIAPGKPM